MRGWVVTAACEAGIALPFCLRARNDKSRSIPYPYGALRLECRRPWARYRNSGNLCGYHVSYKHLWTQVSPVMLAR